MIKSTIYCSKCGKGNVIESPSEGHRFRCVNCNELNQVQARKPAEDGAKRLKEVYQRTQQNVPSNNLPGRIATLRHKKTLVDKNIDLLEKVEAMEKETLELKNEYLEMTHQLSQKESQSNNTAVDKEQWQQIKTDIEKVSAIGGKLSGLDDIKEILLNIQTEPPKAVDFTDIKSFFQKELKAELEKLSSSTAPTPDFTEIKDIFQKEMKSLQHVMNTVAGEVRVLRKELEEVSRKLMSGQVAVGSSSSSPSSSVMPKEPNVSGDKTTDFIAMPETGDEARGEPKSPSTGKKGSKSFKAVSDKLKSLKL